MKQHFYRKFWFRPVIKLKFIRKSISHLAIHISVLRKSLLCFMPKELQPWPEQETLTAISCISYTQNHQAVIRVTADFPAAWNSWNCMQMHTQTHIWLLLIWIVHRQTRYVYTYRFTQCPSGHFPGDTQERLQKHLGDVVTRVILQSFGSGPSFCRCLSLHLLPMDLPRFWSQEVSDAQSWGCPSVPELPTPVWSDGKTLPARSSPIH